MYDEDGLEQYNYKNPDFYPNSFTQTQLINLLSEKIAVPHNRMQIVFNIQVGEDEIHVSPYFQLLRYVQ